MTEQIPPVPGLALGRRPKSDRPTLKASRFLTGVLPEYPRAADHMDGVTYGMNRNDRYGVCGPTSLDHLVRTVTKQLTGTQRDASWEDIRSLYVRQNPAFDENDPGGPGDAGVEMTVLLSDAVKHGLGGQQVLGFAEVDPHDAEEIRACVAVFGGVLLGVMLHGAQTAQLLDGRWDYVPDSPLWGGHAVVEAAYDEDTEDVITWAQRVKMTRQFVAKQRIEAYVVILPEHLGDRGFLEGFDVFEFAAAYTSITGRAFPAPLPTPPAPPDDPAEPDAQPDPGTFPGPVAPPAPVDPAPAPDPGPTVDDQLADEIRGWAFRPRHRGASKPVAAALRRWLIATGRA